MNIKSKIIEAHIFKIVDNELQYLLLKRSETEIYPGIWQMVTGEIEVNETAYECAIREIKEETGLSPKEFFIVPNINSFYSEINDSIIMVPVFAARVESKSKVKISDEHSDYVWASINEAKKLLAWPGQINSIQIIEDYFTNKKNFLNFVKVPL